MPKSNLMVRMKASLLLPSVLSGIVILLTFGASLGNGFVNDDAVAIAGNSRAHDPTDIRTIFSSPYWTNTLYRPVTVTAFALLWQIGDGSPLPYFVANLGLTFLISVLLYTVTSRLGASPVGALLATLLFAVHPVHVEVVANGVGIAELLSTTFLLAGAASTLRGSWWPGTSFLLGACGLLAFLSKESGITALALIPLLWLGRPSTKDDPTPARRREAVLTLLLFLVAGLAVRTTVLGGLSGEAPVRALAALDALPRAQTVLGVIPEWTRLLLWPASLQADYGPPQIPIGGPFGWRHATGALVLLCWGAALAATIRYRLRLIAIGLAWIPIALSPVSNLLFPTGILLAERTLFLPSIGVALVVAGLVDALPTWRAAGAGVASALILLGGLRSHSRVWVWRDQQTFFDQIVTDGARSYRSWYSAGLYARQTGRNDEARRLFAESWRLEQRDYRVAEEYGQMLRANREYEAAVVVFEEAYRMAPGEEPLTSRLLESLMALSRWGDAEALVRDVASRSQEDGDRLRRRMRAAKSLADSAKTGSIGKGGTLPSTVSGTQ